MAKRKPESTQPVSPAELRVLRSQLGGFISEIDSCLEVVGADRIYVFKTNSRDVGMERLEAFVRELRASKFAALEGKPYNEKTRKTALSGVPAKKTKKTRPKKRTAESDPESERVIAEGIADIADYNRSRATKKQAVSNKAAKKRAE
ncbi:hypothetical protein Pla52o_35500 [Novipirellula galeiformis]|uniref:Uncharacterized protein n=1 Tax=Novipirellula galeiformis TaxID=2528004 RepID=A0A5C6CCG9_9BACT|nr:hypothetical protein [Novipirellula galeiformis]TWU22493.1 hypothetical protein Pla52o_35500 [Novipirellula galeiformis]